MAEGAPSNSAGGLGGAEEGRVGPPKTPQQIAAQRRLQQTQAQVDEVVDIMRTNVEKVLERDQKLSELDDRADALQQGASQFEQQAGKLKRKFWLKNLKMMIIMGVIGLIVIIIIGVSIFGGGSSSGSNTTTPTAAAAAVVTTLAPSVASSVDGGSDFYASRWLFMHEFADKILPFTSPSSNNTTNSSHAKENLNAKVLSDSITINQNLITSTTTTTSTTSSTTTPTPIPHLISKERRLTGRLLNRGHDVLDPAFELESVLHQHLKSNLKSENIPILRASSNSKVSIIGKI